MKATDGAGNTSTISTNTFSYDNTPPTGSISYTNGYVTSPSVPVTFSATDAVSGVNTASGQLERASATLAGGSCGPFGSFSAVGPAGVTSPYPDSTVVSGNCYEYEYVVSDNAGNTATITSAGVAKVDTVAPAVPDSHLLGSHQLVRIGLHGLLPPGRGERNVHRHGCL